MIKKIIILVICLIFISGCSFNEGLGNLWDKANTMIGEPIVNKLFPSNTEDSFSSREGLSLDIISPVYGEKLYFSDFEDNPITATIKVSNVGGGNADNIKLYLNDGESEINSENNVNNLEKVSEPVNIDFKIEAKRWKENLGQNENCVEKHFTITAEYDYVSSAKSKICLFPKGDEDCSIGGNMITESSTGPVNIKSVKERKIRTDSGTRLMFDIEFENSGSGIVKGVNLEIRNIPSSFNTNCRDTYIEIDREGRGRTSCEMNPGNELEKLDPFTVIISYNYQEFETGKFKICENDY